VSNALGRSANGPVVSGTSKSKVCTYRGGPVSTKITISIATDAEFRATEQTVAAAGVTVITVPGLGDNAWATQDSGGVAVLKGDTAVQVTAPLASSAQVEALAAQIIKNGGG